MRRDVAPQRYARKMEHSYALGFFPTLELLRARPERVLAVILSERCSTDIRLLEELCSDARVPIETNERIVRRLSDKGNCLVIGKFEKFRPALDPGAPHVILVNPSDMGNLGTIIRTCVGFGITSLAVVAPAVDIFHPKVVRASMGALFWVNFQYFENFADYSQAYPDRDIYPFMTDGAVAIDQLSIRDRARCSLVFGNEATGLDASFLNVGRTVAIRHTGNVDSLNLPAAVAIGIYEFTK